MKKTSICGLLLLCIALSLGCGKSGQITATCTDVGTFESKMGIVNIAQMSLGTVLLLDPVHKKAGYLGKLGFSNGEINTSTKRDSMILLSTAKFKTALSGEVAEAPSKIKAAIETEINDQTAFFLSNSVRKDIQNTTYLVNHAPAKDRDSYLSALSANDKTMIAVITSVVYADKFEFRTQASSSLSAGVNTINVGDYKLAVSYSCQNALAINAKQDGIFYKVTYFTLQNGQFVLRSLDIKLNEYEFDENALK